MTAEPEITSRVDLCLPDGRTLNPLALGWSRVPLHRANLRGGFGRTKRWDYWAVLAGDVVFSLVVADVDYLGIVGAWWADLATGESGGREVSVPLASVLQRIEALPSSTWNTIRSAADNIASGFVAKFTVRPTQMSV